MKDYKTITREKVDADPGAARYMSETHLLEEWSDKLLDLVLNGPTLNGFRKDEIRAALRQTYTALKQYEQIGPMASPYMNDPSAIVARAFAELYPGIDYHAQFVPDLCDESGNRAFGLTIFPDDGSTGRAELERELEEGINRDITIMLGYQPPILIKPVIALNKEARSAVLEELKIVPTSTDYIAITVNMEGGADHE